MGGNADLSIRRIFDHRNKGDARSALGSFGPKKIGKILHIKGNGGAESRDMRFNGK